MAYLGELAVQALGVHVCHGGSGGGCGDVFVFVVRVVVVDWLLSPASRFKFRRQFSWAREVGYATT